MITWPAELPQHVAIEGLASSPADGRLRAETDTGPGKVRRLTRAAARPFTARLYLTLDQVMRLERWWDEDTQGGVLPWLHPHPYQHGFALLDAGSGLPLTDAGGAPILIAAWWLVRFGKRLPQATPSSAGAWTQVMDLEVLP